MLAVPEVERRHRRNVQQHRVLGPALDARVHVRERRLPVVRDVAVELLVLLRRDVLLRPRPQRRRLVDGLVLVRVAEFVLLRVPDLLAHQHRQRDVIRVPADDRRQPPARQELVLPLAQVQRHLGAALRPVDALDRVLAVAGRRPAHAVGRGQPGAARDERHAVGDDERRIEPDAELADQPRVLRLVAGQRREELARARLGDRADVRDHLVARHADPVVAHGDRPRVLVVADDDLQVRIALVVIGMRERLEAQLVRGVGRVGDELAQEDLGMAVQRVDHEVQQLLDLRLESARLGLRAGALRRRLVVHAIAS